MTDLSGLIFAVAGNYYPSQICKHPCQHFWLCSMKVHSVKLQVSLCYMLSSSCFFTTCLVIMFNYYTKKSIVVSVIISFVWCFYILVSVLCLLLFSISYVQMMSFAMQSCFIFFITRAFWLWILHYTDAVKVDSAEHDGLGFMEDITGTLSDLVTSPSSQEIKCVESIVYSTFNPPPSYRR